MSNVVLRLARRSTLEIVSFGNFVHDEMLANAVTFPTPPLLMKDFKTHLDDLFTAEVGTQKKTPASFTLRDQKQSVVELDLNQLADYVNGVSKGDVLIIQKAGMEARKQKQKLTGLDEPMMLQIENVSPKKLVLKCSRVDKAANYVFEYSEDMASGIWKSGAISTSTKASITGLITDKEYWIRVRATGTNNVVSDWSDPIAKKVS